MIIASLLGLILIALIYVLFTFEWGATVIIDDLGIHDQRLGIGLIEWQDIVNAHIDTAYTQQYLSVHVRNPEKYLSRLPESQRFKLLQHRELGFTSFSLPITRQGADPVAVLHYVQSRIHA